MICFINLKVFFIFFFCDLKCLGMLQNVCGPHLELSKHIHEILREWKYLLWKNFKKFFVVRYMR